MQKNAYFKFGAVEDDGSFDGTEIFNKFGQQVIDFVNDKREYVLQNNLPFDVVPRIMLITVLNMIEACDVPKEVVTSIVDEVYAIGLDRDAQSLVELEDSFEIDELDADWIKSAKAVN